MKHIIVILLLLFCKSVFGQYTNAEQRMKKGIAGTWFWKKTVCCNMGGGSLKLADSKKKEKTIVLTKDSTVKIFNEDQLVFDGKYKIDEVRFLKDPVTYYLVSEQLRGMLKFWGDTMLIGYCSSDGCDEYFVPQKIKKNKKIKVRRK